MKWQKVLGRRYGRRKDMAVPLREVWKHEGVELRQPGFRRTSKSSMMSPTSSYRTPEREQAAGDFQRGSRRAEDESVTWVVIENHRRRATTTMGKLLTYLVAIGVRSSSGSFRTRLMSTPYLAQRVLIVSTSRGKRSDREASSAAFTCLSWT